MLIISRPLAKLWKKKKTYSPENLEIRNNNTMKNFRISKIFNKKSLLSSDKFEGWLSFTCTSQVVESAPDTVRRLLLSVYPHARHPRPDDLVVLTSGCRCCCCCLMVVRSGPTQHWWTAQNPCPLLALWIDWSWGGKKGHFSWNCSDPWTVSLSWITPDPWRLSAVVISSGRWLISKHFRN